MISQSFLYPFLRLRRRFALGALIRSTIPKLLAIDFDGCLTDDHVLVDEHGTEFVRVSRKDSLGAGRLRSLGVTVLIISTEENLVVSQRAKKIKVEVIQGVQNKQAELEIFAQSRGIAKNFIWAVGNDVNDLGLFKSAGLSLCPSDASSEIKAISDVILPIQGGEGILNYLAKLLEDMSDSKSQITR
jgi:YrbI family 3-deoxy-D-manno-octulosonate 8-phosphate phosphatase